MSNNQNNINQTAPAGGSTPPPVVATPGLGADGLTPSSTVAVPKSTTPRSVTDFINIFDSDEEDNDDRSTNAPLGEASNSDEEARQKYIDDANEMVKLR